MTDAANRARALEAFDMLMGLEETTYLTVEQVITLAAETTGYPETLLRLALVAETERNS